MRNKNHVSSQPRPALRKKSCLVRPQPACEKEIMSRPLAGLGLGWAGLGWAGLAPQIIKKALSFSVRRTWGIPRAQTLMKPVVYGACWSPFCKNVSKKYQKALGFQSKLNVFCDFAKHQKTVSEIMFWSIQK